MAPAGDQRELDKPHRGTLIEPGGGLRPVDSDVRRRIRASGAPRTRTAHRLQRITLRCARKEGPVPAPRSKFAILLQLVGSTPPSERGSGRPWERPFPPDRAMKKAAGPRIQPNEMPAPRQRDIPPHYAPPIAPPPSSPAER